MPTQNPAASNPWIGRKQNRDLLEKLKTLFTDAWGNDEDYGWVAAKLDDELMDFFFACSIDEVDGDDETIIVRFKVPAPEQNVGN